MQVYRRIALLGTVANPNIGDEAVLAANIQKIRKLYGVNCKIYVFSKDATYTSLYNSEDGQVIVIDYLHKFTMECNYNRAEMERRQHELVDYPEQSVCSKTEYEAIHGIFKEIDVLHIIGGGYLNSLWPDMLYEVVLATRIAKKYQKKYFATGISVLPMENQYLADLQEIINGSEFMDFRDDSYTKYSLQCTEKCCVTLDDAVSLNDYYGSCYSEKKYATLLFHNWHNIDQVEKVLQAFIVPFMERCIERGIVQRYFILGFSQDDFAVWNNIEFSPVLLEAVSYENCVNRNSIFAKHIVAGAEFNIGSRFHQAVFSLSSQVPVLSVHYDEYYQNKLESIHKIFNSQEIYSLENLNEDCLDRFVDTVNDTRLKIANAGDFVNEMQMKKDEKIISVYAVNELEARSFWSKINAEATPKISVIIPIYNMDAYLRECLDSVVSQTLKEIEIICVDDGSTDYSQMILAEYAWKDKRVKVITQTNHGVAFARNVGIDCATGEFLYFLDPDDWLPDEQVLSDLYAAAKKNGVLICGGSFKEYASDKVIDEWDGNFSKYVFKEDKLMRYSEYQFDYGWVRFIYNREFIIHKNLRIPSLTFFEDPVFFVRVMHEAQVFYALKRCTYCYRTGYKSLELSYSKTVDLMTGLYSNILFAKEHNYQQLLTLELARIENDYAGTIVKYLVGRDNVEFRKIFNDLNQLIYEDNSRIEYEIYNKLLKAKEFTIWNEKDKEQKKISEMESMFYNSTTWKVGHGILYIPKMIKNGIWKIR